MSPPNPPPRFPGEAESPVIFSFRVLLFLLLFPLQCMKDCVSLLWRRLRHKSDLSFREDFFRAHVRSKTSLAPVVPRRLARDGGVAGPETFRKSRRFGHIQIRLFENESTSEFSATWICRHPFFESPGLAKRQIALLWIHGGAYVFGNCSTQATQLLRVAEILATHGIDLSILSLEYSLAPEVQLPKQQYEAVAAYCHLLEHHGIPAQDTVIGGESAGGHLAIACLLGIADQHLPKPAGALLMYPWVNLDNTAASFERNKYKDRLQKQMLDQCAKLILGAETRHNHPELISFTARFKPTDDWKRVLPERTHINVGSHDLFVDDIKEFKKIASLDGARVEIEIVEGQPHGWDTVIDKEREQEYLAMRPDEDIHMKGSDSLAKGILSSLGLG